MKKKINLVEADIKAYKGKIEVGKPDIEEPTDATIISCKLVKADAMTEDKGGEFYTNIGFTVTYSLKIDEKIRAINENLMGLRDYGDRTWCSKKSAFGMFKLAVDKIEGYDGSLESIPGHVIGKKIKIQTHVINAFGEEFPKIIPVEITAEDSKVEDEIDIEEKMVV